MSAFAPDATTIKGRLGFALQLLAVAMAIAPQAKTLANTESDPPLPMPTYGFNLGNTLESTWGYPPPTQAIFETAAAAGFNAVRVPCAWNFNADPDTYEIDPDYMAEVKQVVDWSLDAGLHVLINIHWDGGWMENNIGDTVDPVIDAKLEAYWTQIATAFAAYDDRLLFAAANEPNAHNPTEMATLLAYYQTFIDTVRSVGGENATRWLALQGGGDKSWLTILPEDPTPNRLMVEYHNYTPSLFTIIHEDQTWGDTIYFWGEAYHYPGNPSRNATWGQEDAIDTEFQQLYDRYVSRGIPVLLGEFHAAPKTYLNGEEASYNNASRLYWNKYVLESAQAHGLSPFYWSTPNSPFEQATGAIVDPDVVAVLTGGAAPPPPNGAPYAVTGLTASLENEGQINVSWAAVSDATSYDLYRATESGNASATPFVTGITDTSYTDTDLNDGTAYFYQVVALNSSGRSGFSPQAHATTPGVNPDPTPYSYETDPQAWTADGNQISEIAISSEQSFAGRRSLAIRFAGATGGDSSVGVSDVALPPGATISFRVWVPSDSHISQIEPFLQDYDWNWIGSAYENITADAWNTFTLTVPSTSITPLKRLGIQFTTSAAWTGACYLDSVDWEVLPAPSAPADLRAVASADHVELSWTASSNAASYIVKRSTQIDSGYATVATTDATTFTDNQIGDNETFYYIVIAANDSARSLASPAALPTAEVSLEDWRFEHFETTENAGEAADSADPDGDGANNWQEYVSGTDPNDAASYLSVESPEVNGGDIVIRFPTVSGKRYRVERSDTLLEGSWITVQGNLLGTGNALQVTDAGGASHEVRFYRLAVTQ